MRTFRPKHELGADASVRRTRTATALVTLSLAAAAGMLVSGAQAPPPSPTEQAPERVFRVPIEGTIDLGLAPFVERVVQSAEDAHGVVVLDVNTFGGRVDAAVLIRDALVSANVRTVAVVNPRAISAGALISLACETIVIVPGGTIGAATPVQVGGDEEGKLKAGDEKMISYMRTEMSATAERRGRRGDVAAAMVDPDVEIEGLVAKGKVLTLTTASALATGIADKEARSFEDALDALGLADVPLETAQVNWAERIARFVSEPMISSLLLSIGFLGIMIELYQPGWGLPGSLGIASLVLFFFGHHVVRLAGWEELLLFGLGVGLLLLELLVIPGFGVAGVVGGALMLAGITLSLVGLDLRVSWELGFFRRALSILATSLLISTAGMLVIARALPSRFLAGRLVLKRALSSDEGYTAPTEHDEAPLSPGVEGVAAGDLRPAGTIRIDGRRYEASSEGDYIPAGTPVRIIALRGGRPVVRRVESGGAVTPREGEPS